MSFGPSNTTKTAENNLGGISSTAVNQQLPMFNAAGGALLPPGEANIASGTNFFNTLLNGNRANTLQTLQPNIDQIRQGQSNALTAINTLMPRGGGRSSALFGQSFAPQGQISNLFNSVRPAAATALPQIGLGEVGAGTGLLGLGNGALNAATGASSTLGGLGQQQQQMTNNLWGGLGSGLFNLFTTPFGGGTAKNGLFGLF
jgi:hypothetical protein